jgi:hypothetical protein
MRATFAFDSLRQFENARTVRRLAEKRESWQQCHNFRPCESNKQRKKILVRSKAWLPPTEFLEFAPRDELKEIILLVERDVNR